MDHDKRKHWVAGKNAADGKKDTYPNHKCEISMNKSAMIYIDLYSMFLLYQRVFLCSQSAWAELLKAVNGRRRGSLALPLLSCSSGWWCLTCPQFFWFLQMTQMTQFEWELEVTWCDMMRLWGKPLPRDKRSKEFGLRAVRLSTGVVVQVLGFMRTIRLTNRTFHSAMATKISEGRRGEPGKLRSEHTRIPCLGLEWFRACEPQAAKRVLLCFIDISFGSHFVFSCSVCMCVFVLACIHFAFYTKRFCWSRAWTCYRPHTQRQKR